MKRNIYKILAEKYSLVKEDGKEDMMSGLNYLTNLNLSQIYATHVSISRGELDEDPTLDEVDSDFILDTFYGENEEHFMHFAEDWPSFEEVILKLKDNQLVDIHGEEDSYYFSLDKQKIQTVINDTLAQYPMEDQDGAEDE
jgi:hypothetical protein